MLVNKPTLEILDHMYSAAFQRGLKEATPDNGFFTTEHRTTGRYTDYSWLGDVPDLRQWLGPRQFGSLTSHQYTIGMRTWERAIEVKRIDIEDDQVGHYDGIFQRFGDKCRKHPGKLAWAALANGETGQATLKGESLNFGNCYDGSKFFATDHGDENQVNYVAGGAEKWLLIDPDVYPSAVIQPRKTDLELVAKTSLEDEGVFMHDKFRWGARVRYNVGYGLWQGAHMSREVLSKDSLAAARKRMREYVDEDTGDLLEINPQILVVGTANETIAKQLINAELVQTGTGMESNVMRNAFKIIVSPWLTYFG